MASQRQMGSDNSPWHWGKTIERKGSFSHHPLLYMEDRESAEAGPCIGVGSLAASWIGEAMVHTGFPYCGRCRTEHGRLKLTRATVTMGWAQTPLNKGFSFIQTCSDLYITKLTFPKLQTSLKFT
jgi:hypothetical protein